MTLSTPVPQAASKTVLTPLASSRDVMNCLHQNKNKNMRNIFSKTKIIRSSIFNKNWTASSYGNISEPIRINRCDVETWEMGS